jgi:hypothetical protein
MEDESMRYVVFVDSYHEYNPEMIVVDSKSPVMAKCAALYQKVLRLALMPEATARARVYRRQYDRNNAAKLNSQRKARRKARRKAQRLKVKEQHILYHHF